MLPGVEIASHLVREADKRRRSGRLTEAEALLQSAFESSEDAVMRAKTLHKLAVVHRRRARYAEAEKCARRAVKILEEQDQAALLGNHLMFLATLLVAESRDKEALDFVERALPLYEQVLGPDHIEVAFVLSVAVRLCRACNRQASARYYERRRLSIDSTYS
ncbi:MAG: tetratricopeptide repeat protein [Deltaproteobacteria bacterium]|nr:tetratricopeptide repeat protein [Deltaproteobacteria bacterium]